MRGGGWGEDGVRRGKEGGGVTESLGGASAQVEGSSVGKRCMLFSGNLESRAVHLVMKVGHFLEVLLCEEEGPRETQRWGRSGGQCKVTWSGLAQRAQTSGLEHFVRMWPY